MTPYNCNIEALHKVLGARASWMGWLESLIAMVGDEQLPNVTIGATGGVREALACGDVTEENFIEFRNECENVHKMKLLLLSGEQEAALEIKSAEYCARICHFVEEGEEVGLLSSGGMSSQVCFGKEVVSLATEIKKGNSWGEEFGIVTAVEMFETKIDELLAGLELDFPPNTTWLAIEMLGQIASGPALAHILKGRVVEVGECLSVLENHLSNKIELGDKEFGERSWKDYVSAISCVIAIALLRKIKTGRVLFLREYELNGSLLKPSWGLGLALELEEEEFNTTISCKCGKCKIGKLGAPKLRITCSCVDCRFKCLNCAERNWGVLGEEVSGPQLPRDVMNFDRGLHLTYFRNEVSGNVDFEMLASQVLFSRIRPDAASLNMISLCCGTIMLVMHPVYENRVFLTFDDISEIRTKELLNEPAFVNDWKDLTGEHLANCIDKSKRGEHRLGDEECRVLFREKILVSPKGVFFQVSERSKRALWTEECEATNPLLLSFARRRQFLRRGRRTVAKLKF